MTIDGRIEAQLTIPVGGSSVHFHTSADDFIYTIPAGTYYPSTLVSSMASGIDAIVSSGVFSGSLSTGASGTGRVTFTQTGLTWTLNFLDTGLATLLGFAEDIVTAPAGSQTGTAQMCGVWIPNCTLACDTDPRRTPKYSDRRETMGPTGQVSAIVGNFYFCHTNVRWKRVDASRIWERSATLANASWEHFFDETQNGNGLSYFSVGSKIQIYDHTGQLVGSDGNGGTGLSGWKMTGIKNIEPQRSDAGGWTGQWDVTIPRLVSNG